MGLTVNFQRPNVREMVAPQAPITGEQIGSFASGIGAMARWSQKQKAAAMMEGKAKAMDRIAEIDKEIAELEGQLKTIEEDQRKFQEERDAQNKEAMEENQWRSYLGQNAKPTEYTQPKAGMTGADYIAAMNKANAAQQSQGMGGYTTEPTDPNILASGTNSGRMMNFRPNTVGDRSQTPPVGTVSPDYVAEEQLARDNAMAMLNAQRKYRWR